MSVRKLCHLGASRIDATGRLIEGGGKGRVVPLARLRRHDVSVGVEEYGGERRPPPGPPQQKQGLPGDELERARLEPGLGGLVPEEGHGRGVVGRRLRRVDAEVLLEPGDRLRIRRRRCRPGEGEEGEGEEQRGGRRRHGSGAVPCKILGSHGDERGCGGWVTGSEWRRLGMQGDGEVTWPNIFSLLFL